MLKMALVEARAPEPGKRGPYNKTDHNMNLGYRVLARIEMLAPDERGRTEPLVAGSSYRPNHNFGSADNREMGIGFIEIPVGRTVRPGETFETEITLFPPPGVGIYPNLRWRIQEGAKLVAWATILAVKTTAENSN